MKFLANLYFQEFVDRIHRTMESLDPEDLVVFMRYLVQHMREIVENHPEMDPILAIFEDMLEACTRQ